MHPNASVRLMFAAALALPCLLAAPVARALEGTIDVKLPDSIAYDLLPIQIELGVRGAGQQALSAAYHVYDMYKNEAAGGQIALAPQGGQARGTIAFTPRRYGWYTVVLYVEENGKRLGGWQKHLGVTRDYPGVHRLAAGERRGGWNDMALQAFTGLMLDRTNTRMGTQNADRVIADAEKYGVTLLMQFEGEPSVEHAREWATRYKGRVKYWEIINEPNFSTNPQRYAEICKSIYPVIKGIDPAAQVMGCDVCGIDLGWYNAFYEAGGGKSLDIISIHDYEGHEGIDIFHWHYKLTELRKIMARHGDADKPIWQTERVISGVRLGFIGPAQAVRITMQRDILETFGVTNDHNSHYYAAVTGYNDVPTFVYSESGPHPAALATRTRWAMIVGRKFAEKLDFGPTGNKIFLGLRYEGKDGQTVTIRNFGCLDAPLTVGVKGGGPLEVVDCFGNVETVPVQGGRATLTVSQMAHYVRLAKGQELTVPRLDFGRNIAGEATFEYSGGTRSNSKILTDGIFQNPHPSTPWGPTWQGAYRGKVFNDKPETFDIIFEAPREVDKLLLFGARSDNPFSALLDYDLQYRDGDRWVTIEEVRTPCPPSDAVNSYMCNNSMWYLDNNFFVHQLKRPVRTDGLRLIVRRITRGCFTDMIVEETMNAGKPEGQWWKPSGEWLEFREIEVYGPPPLAEVAGRLRAAELADVRDREPLEVTVTCHTRRRLRGAVKITAPAGWETEPDSFPFRIRDDGATVSRTVELIPPAEIPAGTATVRLDLVDGRGKPLDYRTVDAVVPAPVEIAPQAMKAIGDGRYVLPLAIRNASAAPGPQSGTASLSLAALAPGGGQAKEIALSRPFGPLDQGASGTVEFDVTGAGVASSSWTASFEVRSGRLVVTGGMSSPWTWRALGPFPYRQGDFDKDQGAETGVDLRKTYAVANGGTAGWKTVDGGEKGWVDFTKLFDPRDNVCAYAVTYVKIPAAQRASISAGSDDGIKIWLNGKVVIAADVYRPASPGQEGAAVDLREGWNEVLLKVTQGGGGWGFFFELTGADGKPIPGVIGLPEKRE